MSTLLLETLYVNAPRWRLACLWLSQVARVLADNWLRLFVVLELAHEWSNHVDQAWHLVVLLWTLPMVVLAPFNGALCNSLPKPRMLMFSAIVGLLAVLGGLLGVVPWLACWTVVALSFAVYGPTRYAFLPAASQDTGLSLPRLNGLFEMGAAAATVLGVLLAGHFLVMGQERQDAFALISITTVAVLALHGATLLFSLPVRFAGDVYRPEFAWQAVARLLQGLRPNLANTQGPRLSAGAGGIAGRHSRLHGGGAAGLECRRCQRGRNRKIGKARQPDRLARSGGRGRVLPGQLYPPSGAARSAWFRGGRSVSPSPSAWCR